MATKEKVKLWTDEDEKIGNEFLKILQGYDGKSMSEKFRLHRDSAAREMYYEYYNHLPQGVKSFISSLGGKKGGGKPKEKKQQIPSLSEAQWKEDLLTDTSMQHGLHPEDDAEMIAALLQKSD